MVALQWNPLALVILLVYKLFLNAFYCGLSLSNGPLIKVVAPYYCPQKTEVAIKNRITANEQSSQYKHWIF